MKFVLSRSSEPAACRRILEGESPTFLGSRPNCSPTFVAITRSFLRPARAFPTIFSVLPSEYTSAVSKKVIPRSRALAIIFFPSVAVTIHPDSSPNDIHPRQIRETLSPVFPSPTYSTPHDPSRPDIPEHGSDTPGARPARVVRLLQGARHDHRHTTLQSHGGSRA